MPKKGFHFTVESRLKMSLAKKGKSSSRKGICLSKETKIKLSESHKGKSPWNKGIKCSALSEEHKAKIRETMRKVANDSKFQTKRIEKLKQRTKENWEGRRRQAEKISGNKNWMKTEKHRKRMSEDNPMYNLFHRANWEKSFIKALKERKFLAQCPNNAEREMLRLLNTLYPSEWEFVGNGKVVFDRKSPDFINVNGRKLIIELYGDYWHRGDDPEKRANVFSPYGYKTLVIWLSEIQRDIESVKSKIRNFVERG